MELMLTWAMVMSLSPQEHKCDDDKCDSCGDDEPDQTEASGRPEPGEREMYSEGSDGAAGDQTNTIKRNTYSQANV